MYYQYNNRYRENEQKNNEIGFYQTNDQLNQVNRANINDNFGTKTYIQNVGYQQNEYGYNSYGDNNENNISYANSFGNNQSIQSNYITDTEIIDNAKFFVRPTFSVFPNSNNLKTKSMFEYGIFYKLHENNVDVPVVQLYSSTPIIRCKKCFGYINCYCVFIDNGVKWRCSLCREINDVPNEYYCRLKKNGMREDRAQRAELINSCFEFIATPEYVARPPIIPMYFAAIDVSVTSIKSGERVMFGLITYDQNAHFYSINSFDIPKLHVLSNNSNDIFLPVQEPMWILSEQKNAILQLLEQLPSFWSETTNDVAHPTNAIIASQLVFKNNGGRVILCQVSDITDSEIITNFSSNVNKSNSNEDIIDGLKPTSKFCVSKVPILNHMYISVDMIIGCVRPTNMYLSSLGELCNMTNGRLFYYSNFCPQLHYDQVIKDFSNHISSVFGWEAAVKIRLTKGWVGKGFYGVYQIRGAELISMTSLSKSAYLGVNIDTTETMQIDQNLIVQLAVLYTTNFGQRRIRIINTKIRTTDVLQDICNSIDVLAISHLLTLKAITTALSSKLADGKAQLIMKYTSMITTLSNFFPLVPPSANPGSLLDTNNPILMLTFICSNILKNSLFSENEDIAADIRYFEWSKLRSICLDYLTLTYMPVLYDIVNMPNTIGTINENNEIIMPWSLRLTRSALNSQSSYLCCNGTEILIWMGRNCPKTWLTSIFRLDNIDNIHPYSFSYLNRQANESIQKLYNIIETLQNQMSNCITAFIIKQQDTYEPKFLQMLTEDRLYSGSISMLELWEKLCSSSKVHMSFINNPNILVKKMPMNQPTESYNPYNNYKLNDIPQDNKLYQNYSNKTKHQVNLS